MSYSLDYSKISGVNVYLELRSTRMFVGKLKKVQKGYAFSYDEKYMEYKKAIPLGPEFPLTKQYFESDKIFPSFWDRVPSKDNPAYSVYCNTYGIDPNENDALILSATIGSKGPSSFIFTPDWQGSFSGRELKEFRIQLKLTTREFAIHFGLAQSTVVRVENGKASGTEVLRLLEIVSKFQKARDYYIDKCKLSEKLSVKFSFTAKDLKIFRSNLGFTTRDFAICFGISQSTIVRIENGKTTGVEVLRLLEILHEVPEAAVYYIEKYGGSLHSKIKNKVLLAFHAKQFGGWADVLSVEEFDFTKQISTELRNVGWAQTLLNNPNIQYALNYVPREDPYRRNTRKVKTSLFEVRFAYAIYKTGLSVEYEFKAKVGDSSVDFRVWTPGETNVDWLIELTSLGDSEAVKENTTIEGNFYRYSSSTTPWDEENSPEVRDLIKIQQAILNKVCKEHKGQLIPIKFPDIQNNYKSYHVIIVDIRGFGLGYADFGDYINILYGSDGLDDVYKRVWITEEGKKGLIKGIFNDQHPDPKAKILQKRVHAVGFISEKKFTENEIVSQLKLYPNKNLTTLEEIRTIWPLKDKNQ